MSLDDLFRKPPKQTVHGRVVSRAVADDGDGRKSAAHAERAAERMRKMHADPAWEARRIAAAKAAAAKRKAARGKA